MVEDHKSVETLIACIEEFRQLDPEIQAQSMLTLLYAALWEDRQNGVSVKDIGEQLGVSSAASSRNVSNFTKDGIKQSGGYDLLETREDPQFRVRKTIRLTPKGRRFLQRLQKEITK